MPSYFKYNNNGLVDDFSDVFIPRSIFSQGGLWVTGGNSYGQLGTNDLVHRSSPVQTVAGGTNWKQVAGGAYHSLGIKTDGTLWAWGYNLYGQLGDGTSVTKSSPVQTVAGGTNWKQVAGGDYHSAAIKTDGTLWTWGYNLYGALGDNTFGSTTYKSSPVQTIAGGTNWKQVACGDSTCAAIKTDGTLWTWGYNLSGQLGANDTTNRSSPVQTVVAGTTWKQVTSASQTMAAIKTDGTLWLWGHGGNGQMGDFSFANRLSPGKLGTATDWKQITNYEQAVMAIKTNGTLWGWGFNSLGRLGTGGAGQNFSSPVQTSSAGTNWKQIAMGSSVTTALKTDGTIWVWGGSSVGTLGLDTVIQVLTPVQLTIGGTNWKQVSASAQNFYYISDIY